MKLLNIDGNPKTIKGQKRGYMTAILYLSPWKSAGANLCAMAELAGCFAGCLNQAGHGGMAKAGATIAPYGVELADNNVQRARIRRSRLFIEDRDALMLQLHMEVWKFVKKAKRARLIPVARPNGTSDIQWEKIKYRARCADGVYRTQTIFDHFPDLQFYDYTKIAKRFERKQPDNYYLCLSYSNANPVYALRCQTAHRDHGASLVFVVRSEADKLDAAERYGESYVDGDENDLRFLDPPGAHVFLRAKGPAKNDRSGFVVNVNDLQ